MSTARPDPLAAPLGEVLDFLGMLWAVEHSLNRLSKRLHATLDVTGPQRLVLRVVGRFPGIPSGEVASILRLDPSTMSGILVRLERRGLIQRRPDPRDRRRILLALTVQGRELDVDETSAIDTVAGEILAGLSATDVAASRRVLERLATEL